jgi:3-methylcrotonyl-CoA carboxylase alpha subunit
MPQRLQLYDGEATWSIRIDGAQVVVGSESEEDAVTVAGDEHRGFVVQRGAESHHGVAAFTGDSVWVGIGADVFEFTIVRGAAASRGGAHDRDALSPPMAATVVRIAVKPGDRVAAGDLLMALEAMKMELPIRAPRDGVVKAINCQEGELVKPGTPVVEIEWSGGSSDPPERAGLKTRSSK